MNAVLNEEPSPLHHAVERLVSEHGLRAVAAAVMVRLMRRRPAVERPMAGLLNDHLRRDIGLPPMELEHRPPPVIPLTLPR